MIILKIINDKMRGIMYKKKTRKRRKRVPRGTIGTRGVLKVLGTFVSLQNEIN